MVCPFCGHTTASADGPCAACGRTLPPEGSAHEILELSRPPSAAHAPDAATLPPRALTPSRVTRQVTGGPLESGQIINGRYHVIRLLGKGGMGAVYQAWDEELGVAVALKVILPAVGEDAATLEEIERRFKRELLLARQITHRNVVRIHDIGEFDGIKFISMPYVKGQDLATVVRPGALPVPKALALARQIVAGLAAAHDAGVVHRDLKPANIMVEDEEHALLMDFGIARSLGAGTSQGTISGTIVGTIEYMAPEQARGEAVDARADIYAVGLILLEMLAGRRQLAGEAAVADLVARMTVPPASVRVARPEVPEPVDAIITKCLQPSAGDRFQSCGELMAALAALDADGRAIVESRPRPNPARLVAPAAVVVVAAAGLAYWAASRSAPPTAAASRAPVSVLVADFSNEARDPIFDGTLAQSLNLAIEGAPFVSAFPRRDAMRVAAEIQPGATLDEELATLVARREGIQIILAGTIASRGNDYTIRVRALDSATGKEISAAREDAGSKDEVLPAVSKLAVSMRRALGDVMPDSDDATAAETFTAASLEAAHTYAQAQILLWEGKQAEAAQAYLRAIELDPQMGRAYAGVAAVFGNMGQREEAVNYYKLAMARLDRMTERERFRTRSGYWILTRDPDRAVAELKELIEKYPADTAGLGNLAFAYFLRREMSLALETGRKATAIYPRNVLQRTNVALYAMYASDFDTAIGEARAVLEINPQHAKAHLATALSHLASGRVADAAATYDRLTAVNEPLAVIGLADLALYEGRAGDAAAILDRSAAADSVEGNTSITARKLTALAHARSLEGRRAEAARTLERALRVSSVFEVQVEAALVYLELGMVREAAAVAERLRTSLQPDPQAYAKVIDGLVLLARNQPRESAAVLMEAEKIADTWLGRFALGRAYVALGGYPEAYAAFENCLRRRGEIAAAFLDDLPTYRFLPPVHYYMGLAQQGLNSPKAAESFKAFLSIKERGHDPLVAAARARLAN